MPKYATIAFDSAGELARLYFSKDMGKGPADMEKIRAMNNYPGTTERLNMLVRRMKTFRDEGMEIVFTAHEDIEKVYARGGAMAAKGQPVQEPVAVKGWPDIPGRRAPDEFCRAADNVFRVRYVNGKPAWIAKREPISSGNDYWEVKTRFWGEQLQAGLLPASYSALRTLAEAEMKKIDINWHPPYIWMLYGPFGIQKTLSLRTFPRPIRIFDLDGGTGVIPEADRKDMDILKFDPEDAEEYPRFIKALEASH